MISVLKTELRWVIGGDILALPHDYIRDSDEGICERVLSLAEFVSARNIMMYCSVKREPATREIALAALAIGKTVSFPLCYSGGIMEARVVSSLDELRPAVLGIPAPQRTAPVIDPSDLDLIIVPALAFDSRGYRLGYGGGYYDRFLCDLPAFTVGITRERLIKEELPTEPHDIAVNCVITEDRTITAEPR